MKLTDEEEYEVHGFLASLGSEKSIIYLINSYLKGKEIPSRYSLNGYPMGFRKQNNNLLKEYIKLFIYSNEGNSERRGRLNDIAQNGIKKHLTIKNFKYFEKKIILEINKARKQSSWKAEYFEEILLKLEQTIFP